MAELLSLDDAIALVLERVAPLPSERVAVGEAAGRVLAEAAFAAVDLPPFPSSAMDGFALRSADTPGQLPVVAHIAAGAPAERALEQGEAMAIATGGVVPNGADAVVPVERVAAGANTVGVSSAVAHGANVRPRGGDTRAGEEILAAGTRVLPSHVGALAAAGVASLVCAVRPRAAVLATGTELRPPGEPLEPGQVYEANGPMLAAALAGAGAAVERIAPVEDDEQAHRAALEHALAADVVVTTGGVSVGPHDLVRRVAASLGVEEVFWGVAVKPGRPVSFGMRGRTLAFGLPGNPVSALVGFELFVRPALRALQGERDPGPRFKRGRLGGSLARNRVRDELVRARGPDDALAPLAGQESHMIVRAAAADVLVRVPRGEGELLEGEEVAFLRLG